MILFGKEITLETVLSIINFLYVCLSFTKSIKDAMRSVYVTEASYEVFPAYFYPPLSNESGNTSSAFIPLLVENNSTNPLSITSAVLQDKYNKKIWHKATNWKSIDYSINVPYYDGVLSESINESDHVPINVPPFESRIVKVLFPYSGNNLMRTDIKSEFNETTGGPWTVPYTVKVYFSRRFLFSRCSKKVSGVALVGKRSANSIVSLIENSDNSRTDQDLTEISITIKTMDDQFNRFVQCNRQITVEDIITDCETYLLFQGQDCRTYTAFASIIINDEKIAVDKTATINEIIFGNQIIMNRLSLYIEYGGIGNASASDSLFKMKIETIPGISSFFPCVLVSVDNGESYVGLRVSCNPDNVIPVNKDMEKIWSHISSECREEIITMICTCSNELSRYYYDQIIRKRVPSPITVRFRDRNYVFFDNNIVDEDCSDLIEEFNDNSKLGLG